MTNANKTKRKSAQKCDGSLFRAVSVKNENCQKLTDFKLFEKIEKKFSLLTIDKKRTLKLYFLTGETNVILTYTARYSARVYKSTGKTI